MSSDRPGIEPSRYAVTAIAIGLAIGLRYIQIPGLHLELLGADPIRNAVGQLGIVSIIEAFIVVEVLVAIVPRWRKYRNLGAERRGLVRPTIVLSIAFVSLQAVLFARELENIATVSAVALAWLFNRPSVVQSNFKRIHPTKQAPPMQLGKASLVSAAMLLALSEFSRWSSEAFNIEISMLAIPTVTAVAIDLVQEIRFRLSNNALVTVVDLHQPHSVSAIIKRFSDEGIRALPRAVCHRTLLQFFGPHIPITLLVSTDDLASARALVQTLDA